MAAASRALPSWFARLKASFAKPQPGWLRRGSPKLDRRDEVRRHSQNSRIRDGVSRCDELHYSAGGIRRVRARLGEVLFCSADPLRHGCARVLNHQHRFGLPRVRGSGGALLDRGLPREIPCDRPMVLDARTLGG